MYDIEIKPELLNDIIKSLEITNEKIVEIVKNVNLAMKSLDEDKWKSPEKTKIDNEFMVYLDKLEKNVPMQLNECTNILKRVILEYEKTHGKIQKDVEIVSSNTDEIMEVL